LISNFSKILEKAVCIRLINSPDKYNAFLKSQQSFCKGISTSAALVNFPEDVSKTLDNKVGRFVLDLTKAYDIVRLGWCSQYSDSLQVGQSGDRITGRARFSAPV
jgi:hypothetical protein